MEVNEAHEPREQQKPQEIFPSNEKVTIYLF
jgi:hypothetical protein